MADYTVTAAEAVQWANEYPYANAEFRIKPFPKPTTAPDPAGYLLNGGSHPTPIPVNTPPAAIFISGETIVQGEEEAIVGFVTVSDRDLPNDSHILTVDDERFEIVDG